MIVDMSMIDISSKTTPAGAQAFEKFWKIRRAINLIATQEFKPEGLGLKQALAIYYIGKMGKLSQAELARFTGTDPAAMVRSVEVLVRQGWVTQQDHPHDRRCWELILTEHGKTVEKKIKLVFKGLENRFTQALTQQESLALASLLDKILPAFSQK